MNQRTDEQPDIHRLFRFRQFPVYKEILYFRRQVKDLTSKFPSSERFALTSQTWRALDSILLNIAEGSERYSDVDFSRFLNTSVTSVLEVVACLDAALDDGYVTVEEHSICLEKASSIYRQLRASSAKVRRDDRVKGSSDRL